MGWKLPALAVVLWVIALTMAGVAVGQVWGGPEGAVIGAIPGASAAVLAGFVPTIVDTARRHREAIEGRRRETAAAQAKWDRIGEPAAETADHGPAALLRPDREVVQFIGRETELGVLRSWCASAEARSVRTIVGAGGVGKTRLALKVASEWETRGGVWRRIDAGQEAEAIAAARGLTSGPVLLMVDYAETRADLEPMLRAVLADPGPMRVLLVARTLGEWWDRLIEKSTSAIGILLTRAEPIRLAEQITHETPDAALVADAVPQFAHALNCATPEQFEFELPPHRVPVLVLHTAALVAVLRFRDNPAGSLRLVIAQGLLDELLDHEARYWRRTAARAGLPEDGALLKPAVAAAALLGADDLAGAANLLERVPDLADMSLAQRRAWARWLYGLYPADREGRLGSLQPDLLAETHVVEQLAADTDLAEACLRDLSRPQAEHAMTVLARAWAHHDDAQRLIANALNADLAHLAVPAVSVAVETNPMLGQLLSHALSGESVSRETLAQVAEASPYPSVALAAPAAVVLQRLADNSADDSERAGWLVALSGRLGDLWRLEEALAAVEEAVTIHRGLAQDRPTVFLPDLAATLNSRSGHLYQMGWSQEALAAVEEAITIHHHLAQDRPDEFLPDLAGELCNQSVYLGDLGRREEALAPVEEAASIYRQLAQDRPYEFLPDLAMLLSNQADCLDNLGRQEEALAAGEEAVTIRRQLAQYSADMFFSDLAALLSNRSVHLRHLDRQEKALAAVEEAASIYRQLAQDSADAFLPYVARSLQNQAGCLHDLGRREEALAAVDEAVTIRRQLAQDRPAVFLPDLARSLTSQSMILSDLHRQEALAAVDEAVTIRRQLARDRPAVFLPDLAESLSGRAGCLHDLGRREEALAAVEEAVTIFRRLARDRPAVFLADLAAWLNNQSVYLRDLGRHEESLASVEEAAGIFRRLAQDRPDQFLSPLPKVLNNLADTLSRLNRDADVCPIREEANAVAAATGSLAQLSTEQTEDEADV